MIMALLSEEQILLRDAAKAWVADKAPVAALRKLRDGDHWRTGHDVSLWSEMAAMGWTGVIIPEDFGGSEFGYRSLGLILEETGRTLVASPLHSSGLAAASALILAGNEAQKSTYLPKIADGSLIAALAVDEAAHHAPSQIACSATAKGDGYTLSGSKRFIPDAGSADLLIVAARTSGQKGETAGISLFLVPTNLPGVTIQALHAVDNRGVADVAFNQVQLGQDAVLGAIGGVWPVLSQVLDRARAGLAAEMLGTATQAFEITLDYLKTRNQFGQLIGSFQALQHRAAKMFTELELTRSAVEAALEAIDAGSNDAPSLVSLAKAKANDTLHLVSNEMVQMHGGIGMTDAHDAGLYMKRARVAEALYGSSSFHRDRYATLGGF
jgi:alkylation response protein AidB-like acyl-CoA dehydrogenase